MLNYVSGQYYLLKTASKEPYAEIKPLLVKHGLNGIIMQTIYVTNVFNNSVSNIASRLMNDLLKGIIYGISFLLLIVYNSKVYFQLYEEHIVYKKLNGNRFFEIHLLPLCLIILQGAILLGFSMKFPINKSMVIIAVFIEAAVFTLGIMKMQTKNILSIVKGGCK